MSSGPHLPTRRRLLASVPGLVLAGVACRATTSASSSPRPLTYVAIGASDTVGVGADAPEQESWPVVLHKRLPLDSQLVNLGISGSLLHQALDQQLPVALDSAPDLVTVWLAVNDYGARVPLEPYRADLNTLLGELRAKTRATVLVGNVPDLSALPAAGRFDLRFVDRWNAAIDEVVRQHGATLVDLRSTWTEVREHPEYISSDGFHPSTTGYRRLADLFYASAAPALGLHA
jgi:lysophospholipase L1-like esterase